MVRLGRQTAEMVETAEMAGRLEDKELQPVWSCGTLHFNSCFSKRQEVEVRRQAEDAVARAAGVLPVVAVVRRAAAVVQDAEAQVVKERVAMAGPVAADVEEKVAAAKVDQEGVVPVAADGADAVVLAAGAARVAVGHSAAEEEVEAAELRAVLAVEQAAEAEMKFLPATSIWATSPKFSPRPTLTVCWT